MDRELPHSGLELGTFGVCAGGFLFSFRTTSTHWYQFIPHTPEAILWTHVFRTLVLGLRLLLDKLDLSGPLPTVYLHGIPSTAEGFDQTDTGAHLQIDGLRQG